jgi:mRNA-degrading endonuclease RelE of RelBE toxin-antitoxin system
MRGNSSKRSTKRTKHAKRATAAPVANAPWGVKLHPEVGKDVTDYGLADPAFSPTLGELLKELETNPKQFPKKKGKLKNTRAAPLKFKNVSYRAVFDLDETTREVFVFSLDPHDQAYARASRRTKKK